MTYDEFAAEMKSLISWLTKYTIEQAGSRIYAERCASLEDAYPDFAAQFDEESSSPEFWNN